MQPNKRQRDGSGQPASHQPLIEIRNLRKVRRQGGIAFELRVPVFTVQCGTFVSLVGESGCGKSTLLDLLGLVLHPTSCDLFSFRSPARELARSAEDVVALWQSGDEKSLANLRRSRLGYVLQSGGLLPFLTARQNLRLPLRINGEQNSYARVEQLAEKMGIAEVLGKKPRYLSGGQRQRVAILRAMVHRPALILADEPTAAVDRVRARSIVEEFKQLAVASGCSVIMVTHDPKLVEQLADASWTFRVEQASGTLTRSICEQRKG